MLLLISGKNLLKHLEKLKCNQQKCTLKLWRKGDERHAFKARNNIKSYYKKKKRLKINLNSEKVKKVEDNQMTKKFNIYDKKGFIYMRN